MFADTHMAEQALTQIRWNTAIRNYGFLTAMLGSLALMFVLILLYPRFFIFIEGREGAILFDAILAVVPPVDLSVYIFMFIWLGVALIIWQSVLNAAVFINVLVSYTLLSLMRICTLYFFPLQAPPGLIILVDPLTAHFYGQAFISKDLFFSGHTATLFLFSLCVTQPWLKLIFACISLLTGAMLLLQHVHYTIDVAGAFFFAFLAWYPVKYLYNFCI